MPQYFIGIPTAKQGADRINEIIDLHMKAGVDWGLAVGVALNSVLIIITLMAWILREGGD